MKKVRLISSLLLLAAIATLLFGMPAYQTYQTKKVLVEVIAHGFEESQKIDLFIEKNAIFPTVKNMKEADLLSKTPILLLNSSKMMTKNK